MNWQLVLILVAVVGFVVYTRVGKTSGQDARKLVADGAQLVDVRTPEEFSAGHIDGALNVPVGELPKRIGELGAKERPIVVYCRSGARSARAAGILKGAGFTQVHDIGPMSAW